MNKQLEITPELADKFRHNVHILSSETLTNLYSIVALRKPWNSFKIEALNPELPSNTIVTIELITPSVCHNELERIGTDEKISLVLIEDEGINKRIEMYQFLNGKIIEKRYIRERGCPEFNEYKLDECLMGTQKYVFEFPYIEAKEEVKDDKRLASI